MKKALLLLLVAASSILAEVNFVQRVIIELPADLWEEYPPLYGPLSSHKDEDPKQECPTYLSDSRIYSCSNEVCPSIIDTNILFFTDGFCYQSVYKKGCVSFVLYVFSGATHSVMDVVRDELKHNQKCDYIAKDNLLLDSLLNEMDSLSTFNDFKNEFVIIESEYISHLRIGRTLGWEYESDDYIYDYIDKLNGKTSIPYSIDFSAQLHIEGDRLVVPQELVGKRFEIIDFKGRLQSKGLLQNNMQLPHTKAILRIQGVRSMLLNTPH